MSNFETFSINPGTGMMDVIGHSGYTFNFAIADLIDNCISANAKNIKIFFDLTGSKPFLYIKDDGVGMSLDKLKEAAVIGFKKFDDYRDENDLGRYSTGLKSATKSFCNTVTICSKEIGKKANAIKLDYRHIIYDNKWEAFILKGNNLNAEIGNYGTIVFCEDIDFLKAGFDKNSIFEKIEELENALSHIFSKYLIAKKIKIGIQVKGSNMINIEGWNPFSVPENKATKVVYEKNFEFKSSKVRIKAYILPTFNNLSKRDQEYMQGKGLLEQSGFYIYRNGRLIQEGGWLNLDNVGLDDKSKYARIEVDISSTLDKEFQINFSKNSLIIPDPLKPIFLEVAKKARKESRSNFNYQIHPELKRKTKKETDRIWKTSKTNEGLVLTVNLEHPLIKQLSKEIPKNTLKLLITSLSKSLPINLIQSQETTINLYSISELKEMMKITYNDLIKECEDEKMVAKRMASMEPFKDNLDTLMEFFNEEGIIKC